MNESLDSRQLKAFTVLAETGSFTKTARQLYLTHSAISHSMKALENEIGCRLLAKLGKKTILTEAGEAFLPHARRALAEMSHARTVVAELNKWGSRRLRLAVDSTLGSTLLTPVLLKFYREYAKVHLRVEFLHASDPATLVENNQADLVLAEKPADHAGLAFVTLLADHLQFVVNPGHPLADRPAVTRKELSHYPCLLLRTSAHARKQLDEFLARRGLNLSYVGEMESVDDIKAMVKQFPLMSLLPGWSVAAESNCRALISLSLGRDLFEQSWGVIHSNRRPLNHAESGFVQFCRQQVSQLAAREKYQDGHAG